MKVEISRDEAFFINLWANQKSAWVRSDPFVDEADEEARATVALYTGIAVKMARVIAVGLSKTDKQGKATNDAG